MFVHTQFTVIHHLITVYNHNQSKWFNADRCVLTAWRIGCLVSEISRWRWQILINFNSLNDDWNTLRLSDKWRPILKSRSKFGVFTAHFSLLTTLKPKCTWKHTWSVTSSCYLWSVWHHHEWWSTVWTHHSDHLCCVSTGTANDGDSTCSAKH